MVNKNNVSENPNKDLDAVYDELLSNFVKESIEAESQPVDSGVIGSVSFKKRFRSFSGLVRLWLKRLLALITILGAALCTIVLAVILYVSLQYMPDVVSFYNNAHSLVQKSTYDTFRQEENSYIYDSDGNELAKLKLSKNSDYVKIDDIPKSVIDAFVSTEDRRFYQHNGVDLQSTLKAVELLVLGKLNQTDESERGGSTITQQLAKNVYLTNEKTYTRKLKEIFIALELEKKYSKEEILEFYVNNVYFYSNCYGISSASQYYFSKDLDELTLAEVATLCAIPNSPYYYNPISNYDNNLKRRNLILRRMRDQGFIGSTAYSKAKNTTTVILQSQNEFYNYEVSYAIDCAVESLMRNDGFEFKTSFTSSKDYKEYRKKYLKSYDSMRKKLYSGGYKITTTINSEAQEKLQDAVDTTLATSTEKEDGSFVLQGAATVINNDGKVVAIVGGRTEGNESSTRTLNRAFQSYTQPGSTFKPLVVYTPAFEKGYSANSIVNDQEFEGGPVNSDGTYKGLIKLSTAVIESRNTVAWQLLDKLGPKTGLAYVQKMNFSRIVPDDYYDAASLGGLTYGVNTVEMASGYSTLKNNGVYREATCISSIKNSDGEEIYRKRNNRKVYDSNATKEMTSILQRVITEGTGKGLGLERGMPAAGKTGTTNSQRSAWFCGYSPYYSIAVWVGTDDNRELEDLWGSTYPGHIWQTAMNALCEDKEVVDFDTAVDTKEGSDTMYSTTEENLEDSLVELLQEYGELKIDSQEKVDATKELESEIENLLAKVSKDSRKFYQKSYDSLKERVQKKIETYRKKIETSRKKVETSRKGSSNNTSRKKKSDSGGDTRGTDDAGSTTEDSSAGSTTEDSSAGSTTEEDSSAGGSTAEDSGTVDTEDSSIVDSTVEDSGTVDPEESD